MRADASVRVREEVLYKRTPMAVVLVCGGVAALPLLGGLGLLGVVAAWTDAAALKPLAWLFWGCVGLVYGSVIGAGTAVLHRWGHHVGGWGALSCGLLLWPASLPLAFLFVLAVRSTTHAGGSQLAVTDLPADVTLAAIEAVAVAAWLATSWFASWVACYTLLLRRIAAIDECAVMEEMLRRHYQERRAPGHARATPRLSALDVPVRGRRPTSRNHGTETPPRVPPASS